MPLILAIESDHRQAGHLVQIVRRRLGAELILAETFEAALPAIGNRIPDLILVPALLSPEDDAALKFVLRVISDSSHVQVLTTPMFGGSSAKASPSRSMLPGFLRTKTNNVADGCDPEEFARHVASYLQAAAEKRATVQAPVLGPVVPEYEAVVPAATQPVEPPPIEPLPIEPPPIESIFIEPPTTDAPIEPALEDVELAPELVELESVAPFEIVDEVSEPVVVEDESVTEPVPELVAPIEVADEAPAETPPERLRETPPVAVDTDAFDRLVSDLDMLLGAAGAASAPLGPALVRERITLVEDRGEMIPPLTLEQLAAELDSRFRPSSTAVIERAEIEPARAPVASTADPGATANEWGLFDPKQCGLEALLVKLKEMTDSGV